MNPTARRLMWHGMFLFLLGLVTGFAETSFANMRMGVAAHLEGVMNGIFLLALGAAWPAVKLKPGANAAAFWLAMVGTYGNWLFTTLAAVWNTAALSPTLGPAHPAQPWQEHTVTIGFLAVGLAILATALLTLWGLRANASA